MEYTEMRRAISPVRKDYFIFPGMHLSLASEKHDWYSRDRGRLFGPFGATPALQVSRPLHLDHSRP